MHAFIVDGLGFGNLQVLESTHQPEALKNPTQGGHPTFCQGSLGCGHKFQGVLGHHFQGLGGHKF